MSATSYVVVLRGPAGLHLGLPENAFVFRQIPTPVGPVTLTFRTRRVRPDHFINTIRRGLVVEVRGDAPSLREAIDAFANAARGFAVVLSLSANVPVGPLTVELAYDVTPERAEREFFQRFLLDEPLIPHPGRIVLAQETSDLLLDIARHDEGDRIHRATVHYAEALLRWEPGNEVLALGSLWVGIESLTPVALRRELMQTGLTREQLAAAWGIELKRLDAEVRRRVLFRGDDKIYSTAKDTSDAFEHSFKGLTDVRASAKGVRDATGDYLRYAIIDLAGVNTVTKQVLLSPPFDHPIWWTSEKYTFGRLIADTEDLARDDEEFPILRWTNTAQELPVDEFGDARFELIPSVVPAVAEGVEFALDSVGIWVPQIEE